MLGTIAIDNSQANTDIDETTGKASDSQSKISGAFKKIGTAVATYFTVSAIKDFGMSCINAAADASAASSQFSQVFGEFEGKAKQSLASVAEEGGISENRLKGSFTQIAAFAKTTGMDTESALNLSERAMIAVADSAAFYDRSIEDTTESLQSFLKGNYENDAALGLSCTETTRNAAANKLYGKSFNELSESQKQLTLLQMVEDANAASGALGQAARESDTWTNVTGNLKQAWTDFQATIGSNILPSAVGVIKTLVEKVQLLTKNVPKAVEKLKSFASRAREIGTYVGGKLKPIIDDLKAGFENIKIALQPVIDAVSDYVTQGGLANDITSLIKTSVDFLAIGYSSLKGVITSVVDGIKSAVEWGREHKTGLELIAVAVGTLTTAIISYNIAQAIKNAGGIAEVAQLGILQVQLWALTAAQTAQTVATTVATAATSAFGAVMAFVTSPITLVVAAIGALIAIGVLLYRNWDTVKEKCSELWNNVKEKFEGIKETVSQAVENIKTWINNMVLKIPEIGAKALETAKTAAKTAKEKIVGWINRAKGTIPEQIKKGLDNAKTDAQKAKEKIVEWIGKAKGTIPEQVKTALDNAKNYAQRAKEKIIEWIGKAKGTVPGQVLNAFDRAKTAAQNAKEKIVEWIGKAKGTIPPVVCDALETAKTVVSNAVEKIKGLFNFSWKLPDFKLPHISVSGGTPPYGIAGKGSLPHFSVEWYEKAMDNAMILNDPTIFGYDAASGKYLGAGESGSEVVAGSKTLMGMIGKAVSDNNSDVVYLLEKLIDTLYKYFPQIIESMGHDVILDSGALVGGIAVPMNTALGKLSQRKDRGR